MSEFEVFKDLNLFLRKVIFRYWHSDRGNQSTQVDEQSWEERESLEALVALLEENQDFDSDTEVPDYSDMLSPIKTANKITEKCPHFPNIKGSSSFCNS